MEDNGPYHKSKPELKSNSSEILPVNRWSYLIFCAESQDIRTSSLSFVTLSLSRITHTLAFNWQNFAQGRFYNTALYLHL